VLKTMNLKLGRRPKAVTAIRDLADCEIHELNSCTTEAISTYHDFPTAVLDFPAHLYGLELAAVRQSTHKLCACKLDEAGEMVAHLVDAIRSEMAGTLADVLLHQAGLGTLGHPGGKLLETMAQVARRELKWDQPRMECELLAIDRSLPIPKEYPYPSFIYLLPPEALTREDIGFTVVG
jgi:glycerol-3-phosphate dehydrogenase